MYSTLGRILRFRLHMEDVWKSGFLNVNLIATSHFHISGESRNVVDFGQNIEISIPHEGCMEIGVSEALISSKCHIVTFREKAFHVSYFVQNIGISILYVPNEILMAESVASDLLVNPRRQALIEMAAYHIYTRYRPC